MSYIISKLSFSLEATLINEDCFFKNFKLSGSNAEPKKN